MSDAQHRIRTAIERGADAMRLRPAMGRGTAVTRARLREGLACEIDDGRWHLEADMSERAGGTGSAPDPGVYGRSALASCLVMGYVLWAARLEVPLDGVEVTVEADYDVRGEFGITEQPPSYSAVRCRVVLESTAPRDVLERLAARAEDRSPYLDLFRRPIHVTTELVVSDRTEA